MGESSLIEGGKDWQVDFLDAVKVKWKKIVVQMKTSDFGQTSFLDGPK